MKEALSDPAGDDLRSVMDGLRKRSSKALQRSSSSAGASTYSKMAVESVHSGIVIALDKDCRAYRAEIAQLEERITELEDQVRPNAAEEHYHEKVALAAEVKLLRTQMGDAARAREADKATIASLRTASEGSKIARAKEQLDELVAARDRSMRDLEDRLTQSASASRAATTRIEELRKLVAEYEVSEDAARRRAEAAEAAVRTAEARAEAAEAQAAAGIVAVVEPAVIEAAAESASSSVRVQEVEQQLTSKAEALSKMEAEAAQRARRMDELETACAAHEAEARNLRQVLEETRAANERASKAELAVRGPSLPPASHAELGRANAQVENLTVENERLKEKLEHMSLLLSKEPLQSSAATSPLKPPRRR